MKIECILNMIVITKNYHTFYTISEFVTDKYIHIAKTTSSNFGRMLKLIKCNLVKIYSSTTQPCGIEKITCDHRNQDFLLNCISYIFCDSHNL